MKRALAAASAVIFVLSAVPVSPQEPSFEVASVKKVANPDGIWTLNFAPERFDAVMSVRELIVQAFSVLNFQLVGGPGWISSDQFAIVAKAPGQSSTDQIRQMLKTLLAQRFKLKTHLETKNAPAYDLVMARGDGRKGPQLRETSIDCAALGINLTAAPTASKGWCGIRGTGFQRMTGQGATMKYLATILSQRARRMVIDETGLAGGYDFELVSTMSTDTAPTDSTPQLGTALEEQLGLRLKPSERPLQFLVIDQVEQPTAD